MKIEDVEYCHSQGIDIILHTTGLDVGANIITVLEFDTKGSVNPVIEPDWADGLELMRLKTMSRLKVPHVKYFCPNCRKNHWIDSMVGWDHRDYGIYARTINKPDRRWIPNFIRHPYLRRMVK